MNFFEAQDRARQRTVWLVFLFVVAVVVLIAGVYFALHVYLYRDLPASTEVIDIDLLTNSVLGILFVVSAGTIYKVFALSIGGGGAVAESLGGYLILPNTRNADERMLLNVVEEMALASGVPVPPVYLIPEPGINAFAAGTKVSNAVIGFTKGALEILDRDQIQGVIAHEFSHIINGDMRLNLRLIGVIHGIMLLGYIGYFILRSSIYGRRSSSQQSPLPLVGLALIIVGFVGTFFGNWIRASVSRQREFLADAAAVQFTRNPLGIGSALQKIGTSAGILSHPKAAECAHMYFADGIAKGLASQFASHPPIKTRIKKVLPQWDGKSLPAPDKKPTTATVAPAPAAVATQSSFAGGGVSHEASASPTATTPPAAGTPPDLFAALFGDSSDHKTQPAVSSLAVAEAESFLNSLPLEIRQAAEDSYTARALIYAILLDTKKTNHRKAQLHVLKEKADSDVYDMVLRYFPQVISLPRSFCLSLALRDIPALRLLSAKQYEVFLQNLELLIAADSNVDLYEWSVQAVVIHCLDEHFGKKQRLPNASFGADAAYSLSILARAEPDDDKADNVFEKAQKYLPTQVVFDPSPFAPQKLFDTMKRLANSKPKKKEKFMRAVVAIVEHDGVINDDEGALMRAYAALLDCPINCQLLDSQVAA